MPKKVFVTRHRGAIKWAAQAGIKARKIEMLNFDPSSVESGDVVMGTLPVQVAAEVNARGGRYWHLSMDTPPDRRGQELTADDMRCFGARLEEFAVRRMGGRLSAEPDVVERAPDVPAIHVCIATGQTLPNLLPLAELPWKRLVIFASEAMKSQAKRLRELAAVVAASKGGRAIVEVVSMPAREDWAALSEFAASQAERLAGRGLLDVNLTGGQKVMTLAFAEAFRPHARLLYCATDAQKIDVVGGVAQEAIALRPDLLAVETYLRAQGYKTSRRTSFADTDGHAEDHEARRGLMARQRLTIALVTCTESLGAMRFTGAVALSDGTRERTPKSEESPRSMRALLHWVGSAAQSKRSRSGVERQPFLPHVTIGGAADEPTWRGVFDDLQRCDLIRSIKRTVGANRSPQLCFELTSEAAAAYLGGGYLEEYVLHSLLRSGLPKRHFAGNVGIAPLDKSSPQVSDELNELDAVAVWRNRLLVIECKGGSQLSQGKDQDILNKLSQLKDKVGGTLGKGWLVSLQGLARGVHADVFERARLSGIEIISGPAAVSKLATRLAREFELPAAQPWSPSEVTAPWLATDAERAGTSPRAPAAARNADVAKTPKAQ